MFYAQTLIIVNLSRELVQFVQLYSKRLSRVVSVFDHIWTQDSPIYPLTVGGKTGPDIDQGWSTLKVSNIQKTKCSRLLTFERR